MLKIDVFIWGWFVFVFSLPNHSNDVRWSVDLRWQSPHEKWGFYNIAEGILFRSSQKGNITPDWEKFLRVNRKEEWQKRYKVKEDVSDVMVASDYVSSP